MKAKVKISLVVLLIMSVLSCQKYEVKYHANLAQNIGQEEALFLLIDGNQKGMIPYNSSTEIKDDPHSLSLDFGYGRYVLKVQDAYGTVKSSFVLYVHKNRIKLKSKTGSGSVIRDADHLSILFLSE